MKGSKVSGSEELPDQVEFERIQVGDSLGRLEWAVSRAGVDGLIRNDDDHHEWYESGSPFGPPVVPVMATYPPVRLLISRTYGLRGMFVAMDAEFRAPIYYDDPLIVTGVVGDKWVKRGRQYVRFDAEGRRSNGELVFTTRRTHILSFRKVSE